MRGAPEGHLTEVARESTKGSFSVNRTMIRGITAATIGSGLLIAAAVVGPAIANGAESEYDWNRPLPIAEQNAAAHWTVERVPSLRHLDWGHPHRHAHRVASRSSQRASLTGSPQTVAHAMVLRRGWGESGWSCLDELWNRESGWETYATNSSSGAYGIPQALPGYKMAAAGSDWRTNPVTQITWGLDYIASDYGSPCVALSHSSSYGYY